MEYTYQLRSSGYGKSRNDTDLDQASKRVHANVEYLPWDK